MNLLGRILCTAGLAAAVMAVVQLARQLARLREAVEELRNAKVPDPGGAARPRADVRPMFGELYQARPSPFKAFGDWSGVPLAFAAAGLIALGLFTTRPARAAANGVDSTNALDISTARLRYDSLAREVGQLRDSIATLRQGPPASPGAAERPTGRPVQGKPNRAPVRTRPTTEAAAVAPLPSMPKVSP